MPVETDLLPVEDKVAIWTSVGLSLFVYWNFVLTITTYADVISPKSRLTLWFDPYVILFLNSSVTSTKSLVLTSYPLFNVYPSGTRYIFIFVTFWLIWPILVGYFGWYASTFNLAPFKSLSIGLTYTTWL